MSLGLVDQRSARLPAEVTGFVGREKELAGVTALLRSARLVTVTGTGGVGKTRVATRAAGRLAGQFGDGASAIDLSAEDDPAAVLDAVLDDLYDRNVLLLLDTCDHAVDACAMFAQEVLAAAPRVTLLATSRQPLDVHGEATYRLAPMPVPGPDASESDYAVMRLFAQRAAAVVPGFAITDANRPQVAAVCRRLDGIPLAIEMAAVRLRALPLPELAARLERRSDGRLALLTGGRRGSVGRQQGMRETAKWSYDSCTPAERALWERLSVFADGFSLDAAQEVCASGELPRERIIDTVASLTDKSVLLREDGDTGTRYRLPEPLREFGAERLAAMGTDAAIRHRHAVRYLALARQSREPRDLWADRENFAAAHEYMLREARDGDRQLERDGIELGHWLHAQRPPGQFLDACPAKDADPDSTATGNTGPALEDPLAGALTSREREIAELVATGLSNREIAQRANISKRTVDAHVAHIFAKLGVSSRVQLAAMTRGRK